MTYKEEKGNLFDLPNDYTLCQCISADFGMGAGIAVEFNKRYDVKNSLIRLFKDSGNAIRVYHNYLAQYNQTGFSIPIILQSRGVINLVTKRYYWDKPTYKSLTDALMDFKRSLPKDTKGIKLGMPKIGCGLDRLDWSTVSCIIKEVFEDTEVEIVVRYL